MRVQQPERVAIAFLIATQAACAASSNPSRVDDATLVIKGVTIIDLTSNATRLPDQSIVISAGRIVEVGPVNAVRIPSGARVLDGRGKFAIPGLWDAHVHFMNTGPSALPLYVANGVTTVREMGGYIDSTRAWQARMSAGTLVGPRIKTPGPILESPRYLAGVRSRDAGLGGRLAPRVLPYRIGVGDSAEARRAIDSLRAFRVDFVKIRTVASPEAYLAILATAMRAGLMVDGHPPGVVSIGAASDAGQRTIEHGFLPPTRDLPDSVRRALYMRFARNGTWYTPTLTVSRAVQIEPDSANKLLWSADAPQRDSARRYASPWLLGWWRMQVDERVQLPDSVRASNRRAYESSLADVRGMREAGVRILAGTDAGSVLVYPGFGLHEELRLLVEDARLSTREALFAATMAPASLFGMEKELGSIAPGKAADIVLLDADPIASIRNTRRIATVIQHGRVFDRRALDEMLKAIEREVRQ